VGGQPKWDEFEAAILLDAWIKVKNGCSKKIEIKRVSSQLRQMAVNRGIEIDEIYRNVNGISFQIDAMGTAYEMRPIRNIKASKLFNEVAELYRTDIESFKKLLREAESMISNSQNNSVEINEGEVKKMPAVFLDFNDLSDLSDSKPVALYYKDYVITNINSWYGLYLEFKQILGKICPDIMKFDCSIDNNENSIPGDIVFAIKNIFKFFDLDITELTITYKKNIDSDFRGDIPLNEKNVTINTEPVKDELKEKCIAILNEDFEDGYIIGNYMHKMRFSSSFEEHYGVDVNTVIDDVEEYLSGFGRIVDDRIYAPSNGSDSIIIDKIYDDVQSAFNDSASVISIECIFDRYSKELASEMNVYNSETLFNVLQTNNRFKQNFKFFNLSITDLNSNVSIYDEVKSRLKNSARPVTAVELHQTMWYVPVEKLKTVLRQLPEAVYVDASAYYYGPNFYISVDEKTELIKQMCSEIYSKGYLATKNLREIFRNSCPAAAMDSENFKDYGIRELIKYVLDDKFEFNNSVITEKGTSLDLRQVFRDYAAEHERLTLNEIKELQEEVGLGSLNTTYWNAIFDETIRISDTELVRKDLVHFDVKAIDDVLTTICHDSYIPLKDINLFLSFPAIQFRWNGFVLESYLRNYSEKFCLFQVSVTADAYNGVMVRKNSGFETYEDVAADMLAHNSDWSDETSALKLLSNSGFQQRAKNKNITAIVKKAKAIRENIQE